MSKQESEQKTEGLLKIIVPVIVAAIGLLGILAQQGYLKPKETPAPVQVAYSGIVLRDSDRTPIAGIPVSLELQGGEKKEATTDSEGRYLFDLLVTSRLAGKLMVNVEGYYPFTRNVTIAAQDTEENPIPLTQLSAPAPETETPAPTVTLAPTIAATEEATQAPSEAPSQTPAPQVKTLADGCIYSGTWNYYTSDSTLSDSAQTAADGCYSLDALGFYAVGGALNITPSDNKGRAVINSGLYMTDKVTTKVDFVLNINELRLQYEDKPVYITFGFAPASNPQDAINKNQTTRLNFQVSKNENNPLIQAKLAEPGGSYGADIDSNRGRYKNATVSLVIEGNTVQVYLNGVKKGVPAKLPIGDKIFYISYYQPPVSVIDANVKDLTVDGNPG